MCPAFAGQSLESRLAAQRSVIRTQEPMHEISVIVARRDDAKAICETLGWAQALQGSGGWWIVPISRQFVANAVGGKLSLPDLEDPAEAALLGDAIAPLLKRLGQMALQGGIALAFTQYYGGGGAQAAAVLSRGGVLSGPWVKENAINDALVEVGVQSDGGRDPFDSVGLGQWRSMDDFASAG